MARRDRPLPGLGLVLIRLVTGATLMSRGWSWIAEGLPGGRSVERFVREARGRIPDLLAWWGDHVLLVNPDAIAFLVRWVALLSGLCLVLGALTRPAGWIAVFFLTHAYVYGPESQELVFLLLLVSCLACALSRAGRRAGLDRMFDEHFPAWVTWSRSSGSFLS